MNVNSNGMQSLFTTRGRINRSRYILISILTIIAMDIAITMAAGMFLQKLIATVIFLLSLVIYICVTIQRFHDIELPGNNVVMIIIPIINLYFYYLLLFKKGTSGVNSYGEDSLN